MVAWRWLVLWTLLLLALLLLICAVSSEADTRLAAAAPASRIADTAFYINMDHQVKRREHLVRLLSSAGLEPVRVRPVQDDVPFKSLTRTHKMIVERISKMEGEQYHCIFEDDVELADGVAPSDVKPLLREELARTEDPVGFVYLGVCLDADQARACRPSSCRAWCAHAYMITPAGARWLLRNVTDWENHHADYAYMKTLAAPVMGHRFTHDHTHPDWRGLFYQARRAQWYEPGMAEKGYTS